MKNAASSPNNRYPRGAKAGRTQAITGRAITLLSICIVVVVFTGCVVCSADRVFPKLTWRWTKDGQRELESRRAEKAYYESLSQTNR